MSWRPDRAEPLFSDPCRLGALPGRPRRSRRARRSSPSPDRRARGRAARGAASSGSSPRGVGRPAVRGRAPDRHVHPPRADGPAAGRAAGAAAVARAGRAWAQPRLLHAARGRGGPLDVRAALRRPPAPAPRRPSRPAVGAAGARRRRDASARAADRGRLPAPHADPASAAAAADPDLRRQLRVAGARRRHRARGDPPVRSRGSHSPRELARYPAARHAARDPAPPGAQRRRRPPDRLPVGRRRGRAGRSSTSPRAAPPPSPPRISRGRIASA